MNLWPWKNKAVETPAAVDVAAVAREAAQEAVQEVAGDLLRGYLEMNAVPSVPNANDRPPLPLYAYNHPIWFSTPQDPSGRPGAFLSVSMLRKMADTYDILRACIQHLKTQVQAVPLKIVPKDSDDKSDATKQRIKDVQAFFGVSGGLGGFGRTRDEFEGMLLEDLLVIGVSAVYHAPTLGGVPYETVAIDASTIRPRVDAYGWPGPGEDWYEQWIHGVLVRGFKREEMTYLGLPTNARSYTPFPASPVEWLVYTIMSAVKSDEWNRNWLTDGTAPTETYAAPESWTVDQLKEFNAYINTLLKGNTKERQKVRFFPSGSQKLGNDSRKDQDFTTYDLWLLRRTCAIMQVQPASIGFVGEQYKTSQEDSLDATTNFGVGTLLAHRKTVYDDLLERMGYPDLETQNVTQREEAATERATRLVSLVGGGVFTPNEARAEEGKDPINGGDTLFVPASLQPVEIAINPPDSAASNEEKQAKTDEKNTQRGLLKQWERKCLNRAKEGKIPACLFHSETLRANVRAVIETATYDDQSALTEQVKALFQRAASLLDGEND